MRDILITIHSKYSAGIYSGEKKYELRKTIAKCFNPEDGDRVFLCEKGTGCVTGWFYTKRLIIDWPSIIWNVVKGNCMLSKDEFYDYYKYSKLAVAYEIGLTKKFDTPVPLSDFVDDEGNHIVKNAPQNFRYLPTGFDVPGLIDGKRITEYLSDAYGFCELENLYGEIGAEQVVFLARCESDAKLQADIFLKYLNYLDVGHIRPIHDVFIVTELPSGSINSSVSYTFTHKGAFKSPPDGTIIAPLCSFCFIRDVYRNNEDRYQWVFPDPDIGDRDRLSVEGRLKYATLLLDNKPKIDDVTIGQ